LLGNRILQHFEIALIVNDLPRASRIDDMHFDRFLKEHTKMKKAHRKPARPPREEGMVHVEFDLAPGFVIDLGDNIGRRPRRANLGLPRHAPRHGLELIEGKWLRRAKFQRGGREALSGVRPKERERGGSLQHGPPVNGFCHLSFPRNLRPGRSGAAQTKVGQGELGRSGERF
jgi:hypothetical protein